MRLVWSIILLVVGMCVSACKREQNVNRRLLTPKNAYIDSDCKLDEPAVPAVSLLSLDIKAPDAQRFGFGSDVIFQPKRSKQYSAFRMRVEVDIAYANRKICEATAYLWLDGKDWSYTGAVFNKLEIVDQALPQLDGFENPSRFFTKKPVPCWYESSPGNFSAAYEVHYEQDAVPFFGVLTGQGLRDRRPTLMQATGFFSIYERDHASGKRIDQEISDLPESGYLCNRWLMTQYDGAADIVYAATGQEKVNALDENSRAFQFVSAFANANRMMAFFQSIDPLFGDLPRITLRLSNDPKIAERGPFYVNSDINDAVKDPTIALPEVKTAGDAVLLKNLRTDFDVVAHELGHHIISQYLPTDSLGAGIIHEALADFFVAERNGDSCIARTVCTAESSTCSAEGKCLRDLNNRVRYDEPEFIRALQKQDVHYSSQLVSGALWDISLVNAEARNDLYQLIFASLPRIPPRPVVEDMLRAMLQIDAESFAGRFGCSILNSAEKRAIKLENPGLVCNPSGTPSALKIR